MSFCYTLKIQKEVDSSVSTTIIPVYDSEIIVDYCDKENTIEITFNERKAGKESKRTVTVSSIECQVYVESPTGHTCYAYKKDSGKKVNKHRQQISR